MNRLSEMLIMYFVLLIVLLVFAGCKATKIYDEVAKPMYIGVKAVVKESNLDDKIKAKLRRIDAKISNADAIRTDVKETAKIIKDGVIDGL